MHPACTLIAIHFSINSLFADAGMFADGGLDSRLTRLGVAHTLGAELTVSTLELDVDFAAASLPDTIATVLADHDHPNDEEPAALAKALERGLMDAWAAAPPPFSDDHEQLVALVDDHEVPWILRPDVNVSLRRIDPMRDSWRPKREDEGEYDVLLPTILLGDHEIPEVDIAIRRMMLTDSWGVHVRVTLGF